MTPEQRTQAEMEALKGMYRSHSELIAYAILLSGHRICETMREITTRGTTNETH